MVHSKTPGGQQPSEAFLKEQASTQGKGSHSEDSAPQHPLNVPVASDSGNSNVGITEITNNSANKSGAFPSKEGVQNVGVGAPTANVPAEQKENA